jgi:hypothetical protein
MRLRDLHHPHTWEAEIRPWKGAPFVSEFTVSVVRGKKGLPSSLRWLVRDIGERKLEVHRLRSRIAELEEHLRLQGEQPALECEVGADT